MQFEPLAIPGAYRLDLVRIGDERGFFARVWTPGDLASRALETRLAQCSLSFNPRVHTLRGMHYQEAPHAEVKLVRCTRGAIFDVIVDLRPDSPTYCGWVAEELTADNRAMLYIPQGCAHGFQTLTPDSEVFYFISHPYTPAAARGVRWDDPAFGIRWPAAEERIMAPRDRSYPDFQP